MKRPKPYQIILCASVVFVVGVLVAYHNTASLGYGKDAIIYYDEQGVEIMDYRIEYADVREKMQSMTRIVPDTFVTI